MLGDAAALLLEPADAPPDLVDALPGTGFGQPLGEFAEHAPEALGESLDDAALLRRALLGEAVQAHFLAVIGEHLVQMHAVLRRGLDAQRRLGVEVPGAFAVHDQVAVAQLAQPPQALFGGNAAVHHHQGGARGMESVCAWTNQWAWPPAGTPAPRTGPAESAREVHERCVRQLADNGAWLLLHPT